MGIPAQEHGGGGVRRAFAIGAAVCTLFGALLGPSRVFGSGAAEKTRAIVDSGHAGAVRWIEMDVKRSLLFSSGEDGSVRIWDPVAGNLMHTLQEYETSDRFGSAEDRPSINEHKSSVEWIGQRLPEELFG